ncbi:YopX family protein [Lacticaseibacillus paracasei]|uniref:YopX family protein n=1 Tax=Lacticaseibacillus paracasei TaxID=1597 RepID=UPI00073B0686|nr:YopX family protein [Lacticaseibacillus paracasei]KTF00003.1 hypothetical protein AC564_0265c [Lacticaseibacillus paracasei]TXJ65598.1 hypothetical protein FGO89_05855 [Lacticaseibacillus paracasei]
MKREMKFRGLPTCKEKDELDYINFDRDGNFAVGFYEDGYIIGKVADANDEYIYPEFWVAVDRNTVSLYTGLKDKNGREIYENDVLQCTSYTYGNGETGKTSLLVKYDEMSAGFIAGPYMLGKLMDIRKCEVIGNIFENPELLEGKQ